MERIEQVKTALWFTLSNDRRILMMGDDCRGAINDAFDAALVSLEGERGTGAPEDVAGLVAETEANMDARRSPAELWNLIHVLLASHARLAAERDEARRERDRQYDENVIQIETAEAEAATLRARIAELEAKLERAGEVIASHIAAWESLPGGRDYELHTVAKWVQGPMYQAVTAARRYVEEGK